MSYEPSEVEQAKLNTGRLMRAEADVILPLLQEKREAAISTLLWKFKEGKLADLPAAVASLAALEDMRSEIRNKIKTAEGIERKIYEPK
jgi:hypothetical protein